VVTLSDGLPVLGKGGENPEYREAGNPHLWLNPRNAIAYVETIRDTLVSLDPANAETYRANADRYRRELEALDGEIAASIATIPAARRKLVTFHDSFPYYCDRYGLEDLAVVSIDPESEPSAADYAELVRLVRRDNVRAIFGEAGFSARTVQQLAADTGATFAPSLYSDTLGSTPDTDTYVKIMRWNTRTIVDNLK
jgi:manganese/iron transport system substrate-binding protein